MGSGLSVPEEKLKEVRVLVVGGGYAGIQAATR